MAINKLDHYSVRTSMVDRSINFYRNALGLVSGQRPPFDFPGAWLYNVDDNGKIVGNSVVHIVGMSSDSNSGLNEYLGAKSLMPQVGSGALDHIAFTSFKILEMHTRLALHEINYRERKVPAMELHQIFLEDPDGITIELNYSHPDDIAAGQNHMKLAMNRA